MIRVLLTGFAHHPTPVLAVARYCRLPGWYPTIGLYLWNGTQHQGKRAFKGSSPCCINEFVAHLPASRAQAHPRAIGRSRGEAACGRPPGSAR